MFCDGPTDGETDLLQALHDRKVQIEDIVRENVLHEPQKNKSLPKCAYAKQKEKRQYITIYT